MAFKYARSQEAYDRFSAATNLPLTLLAVLWLPTLVFPLVMNLPASVVRTFDLIDLVIWLLYGAEYLIRLYLSPSRTRFITHHLVDLAVLEPGGDQALGDRAEVVGQLEQQPAHEVGQHGRGIRTGSASQIALRYLVQQRIIPIPRTANPEHLADNLAIFDFALTDDEMAEVDGLRQPGARVVNPPHAPKWDA